MTPLPRIGGQAPAARGSDHETCACESSRIGALKTPPAQGGELFCPWQGPVVRPAGQPSSDGRTREQSHDPANRIRFIKGLQKFSCRHRFAMASSLLNSTSCATPTTRRKRQKRASYAAATPSTGTLPFFPVILMHLAEAGVASHISSPHGNASIAAIWSRTNAGPGSRTRTSPPTKVTRKLRGSRNGARQGREKFFHGHPRVRRFFASVALFEPRARSVAVVVQSSLVPGSRWCGRKDREDQESTRACVSHAVRNALGRHEQVSRAHR